MYKYIFLDMDHTIFDFDKSEYEAFREVWQKNFGDYNDEIYKDYYKINRDYWAMFEKGEITQESLKIMRFYDLFNLYTKSFDYNLFNEEYIDTIKTKAFLYDGAMDLCKYLASKYKIIIVTNGLAKNQYGRLSLSGINKYVKSVIISQEVGSVKPEYEIFNAAFEASGAKDKDECIMLGDNPFADIEGATNFGIDSVLVDLNNKYIDYKATYKVTSLKEIYDIL